MKESIGTGGNGSWGDYSSNIDAAMYCSNINQTQHRYLGKEIDHNVYAAELKDIEFAEKILQQSIENYTQYLIQMNNQAIIKAIEKSKR